MTTSLRGSTFALFLALLGRTGAAEPTPIDKPGAYPPGIYRFPCHVEGDDPMAPKPKPAGTKGEIVAVESSFVKRPGDLPSIHSAGTPPECRPVELTPGTYHVAVRTLKSTWVWANVMGTTIQADLKVTSSVSYLTVTIGTPPKPPCSREQVAQLLADLDRHKKNHDELNKKLAEVLDDPGFREAADEVAHDVVELAFETATAIASAGAAGALKLTSGAAKLGGAVEAADVLRKAIEGHDTDVALDLTLHSAHAKTTLAIKHLLSSLKTATKFGTHLGSLIATADQVAAIQKGIDWNTRHFREVADELNRCKERVQGGGKAPGPGQPGGPKPPKGPKPLVPEGGPAEPGGAGEPEGGAEPPGGEASPPPPPQPPKPPPKPPPQRPGLPLPPEEKKQAEKLLGGRGCGGMGMRIEARDASSAAATLRDLQRATRDFEDGPLARFQGVLGRLEGAMQRAEGTAGMSEAQRRQALGFMVPELKGFVPEAESFGKAGDAFLGVVGGCDRSLPQLIDAVRAGTRASAR